MSDSSSIDATVRISTERGELDVPVYHRSGLWLVTPWISEDDGQPKHGSYNVSHERTGLCALTWGGGTSLELATILCNRLGEQAPKLAATTPFGKRPRRTVAWSKARLIVQRWREEFDQ